MWLLACTVSGEQPRLPCGACHASPKGAHLMPDAGMPLVAVFSLAGWAQPTAANNICVGFFADQRTC
jgi:hypothetical protein